MTTPENAPAADVAGLVEQAMRHFWGARCLGYEPSCPTCRAWKDFDALRASLPTHEPAGEVVERAWNDTRHIGGLFWSELPEHEQQHLSAFAAALTSPEAQARPADETTDRLARLIGAEWVPNSPADDAGDLVDDDLTAVYMAGRADARATIQSLTAQVETLEAEKRALRAALGFYAKPANWRVYRVSSAAGNRTSVRYTAATDDKGEIARATLTQGASDD